METQKQHYLAKNIIIERDSTVAYPLKSWHIYNEHNNLFIGIERNLVVERADLNAEY